MKDGKKKVENNSKLPDIKSKAKQKKTALKAKAQGTTPKQRKTKATKQKTKTPPKKAAKAKVSQPAKVKETKPAKLSRQATVTVDTAPVAGPSKQLSRSASAKQLSKKPSKGMRKVASFISDDADFYIPPKNKWPVKIVSKLKQT